MAFQSGVVVLGSALFATPLGKSVRKEVGMEKLKLIITILLFTLRIIVFSQEKGEEEFNNGVKKYEHSDLVGALQSFNSAIEKDTTCYKYYTFRGKVKYDLKEYDNAKLDFMKSLILIPENAEIYMYLCKINYQKSEFLEALANINKVLSIDTKNDEAYYWRGNIRLAISANPNELSIVSDDYIKNNIGKVEVTEINAQTKRKIFPMRSNGFVDHDKCRMEDLAFDDYNRSIELNPNNFLTYLNRAIFYYKKYGNDNEALFDINKSIELNPNYPFSYLTRGDIKYTLHDKVGMIEDWKKARELNSAFEKAVDTRLEKYSNK